MSQFIQCITSKMGWSLLPSYNCCEGFVNASLTTHFDLGFSKEKESNMVTTNQITTQRTDSHRIFLLNFFLVKISLSEYYKRESEDIDYWCILLQTRVFDVLYQKETFTIYQVITMNLCNWAVPLNFSFLLTFWRIFFQMRLLSIENGI